MIVRKEIKDQMKKLKNKPKIIETRFTYSKDNK